jgi:transposase-like protein
VTVLWVLDPAAAQQALRAGLLRCPDCRGALRPWATARSRTVRLPGGGQTRLTPDRARCTGCLRSHVLLPAQVGPRRAYSADVIGASLLAAARGTSRATIAAGLGVPAGTLRDWLRAARRGATALVARAAQAATHLGVSVYDYRSTGSWLGSALAEALDALGVAARALAHGAALAPTRGTDGASGIDYLGLLDSGHRDRHLHEQLRIAAEEANLATVPAWHLANIISAGRLLTSG